MMASYGQHMGSRAQHHGAGYDTQAAVAPAVSAPAGTFQPGTKIQVGSHRVVILKYLSEGGFAHVYVVKLPRPVDGTDQAVLKRVAVPDKEALRGMRTEVETMKRLKGHRMIVTYIDSHASEMRGGGYEVFLLMEYCSGGGLIDFMNTRLQHRLTEPEILDIFCDIAEGVACMHYLKPPLLHRDLKIENVLITNRGSGKRFKLCDFGSSAPPSPAPTSVVDCRRMDEDVQKHTTLQYRSPEMVDVYRKQPINEKADIWALGVFLYKLCYYTTPFEDQGQLAILNASYRFPSAPPFSDRLKMLIASMLKENLNSRPNIYQVVKEACSMKGRQIPIRDIYSGSAKTEADAKAKKTAAESDTKGQPAVGAVFSQPKEEKSKIPEVTPMRRGRPTPSQAQKPTPQQTPSKAASGDPFAALDSKSPLQGGTDEFSSRFPSLDQFSLLHDQGSKFDFESSAQSTARPAEPVAQGDIHRMADEVFASSRSPPAANVSSRPKSVTPGPAVAKVVSQRMESLSKTSSGPSRQPDSSKAQSTIKTNPDLQAISSQNTSRYVSIGTSTTDLPSMSPRMAPSGRSSRAQAAETSRSSSRLERPSRSPENEPEEPPASVSARISSLEAIPSHVRTSSTARALAESKPSQEDLLDFSPQEPPTVIRPRPQSTNFEATTTVDYLREREAASRPQSRMSPRASPALAPSPALVAAEDEPSAEMGSSELGKTVDDSDTDNLERTWSKQSSSSLAPGSRSSKFGDAFKRFEGGQPSLARTPSPLKGWDVAGPPEPERTWERTSPANVMEDEDDMTPEMRREMERLKLEEEEQRVEAAQAEYRKRVAAGGGSQAGGGPPRSMSIQNRVQSLMEENKSAAVQRTAHGYGKYSDAAVRTPSPGKAENPPEVRRKPSIAGPKPQPRPSTTSPALPPNKPTAKPVAPRKPVHLNSLPTGASNLPSSPAKKPVAEEEQLIAVDLPGKPALDMTAREKDNYLEEFSQRFPSLSAMEGSQSNGR